jgi:hypothetical protein
MSNHVGEDCTQMENRRADVWEVQGLVGTALVRNAIIRHSKQVFDYSATLIVLRLTLLQVDKPHL